ncbi:NERD domain-containing protein [Fictibacillus nanhaiensis]|uniref:nuclease-related domain-containing protein n=1 Tax=Fictibacillus nanhaiensis TaxID=742169 RepID=UPI001C970E20|nr:NERD domain-containing protein [Fictibacillus nanhaiensis]
MAKHSKICEKLEEHLAKHLAGLNGEKSLEYFYRYLPQDVQFIHNIRILHMNFYFQMDTLIITSKFIILLEIKNYAGHLYFDDKYGQLIRKFNDKEDIFDDPIEQVKRQSFHLSKILNQHKIPEVPIETLVVLTNPRTYIHSSQTISTIVKSSRIQQKFQEFDQKYKKEVLTLKEKKRIHRILMKLHEPYNPDILEYYGIDKSELITGVLCSECHTRMERISANWQCIKCKHTSKNAHIRALMDYALLISTDITNKECKEFLHLSSSMQAYHILHSLNLPYTGASRRSRTYHLDSLIT